MFRHTSQGEADGAFGTFECHGCGRQSLCRNAVYVVDWHIRWEGTALNGGYSVLVGEADSYVALYAPVKILDHMKDTTTTLAGPNHLGVVVDDIDATEARVIAAGYEPNRHADYEPGRRFYFVAESGVEIEVAQYY